MSDQAIETRKLGFKYGGVVYLSDSFALLKDKVLELGAHRIGGEPGTGVDIRKVIERVDPEALNALARDYPLEYLDEEETVNEQENDNSDLGYADGYEVGRETALEIVWKFRNERISLDGLIDQSYELSDSRGYGEDNGYSEDFLNGLYKGFLSRFETSAARVAALDEALLRATQGASIKLPSAQILADEDYELKKDLSPIAKLLIEVELLLRSFEKSYPATGEELRAAANELADEGDVDRFKELRDLLHNEVHGHNPGALHDLDSFLDQLHGEQRDRLEIEAAREEDKDTGSWRHEYPDSDGRPVFTGHLVEITSGPFVGRKGEVTSLGNLPRSILVKDSVNRTCAVIAEELKLLAVSKDAEPLTVGEVLEAAPFLAPVEDEERLEIEERTNRANPTLQERTEKLFSLEEGSLDDLWIGGTDVVIGAERQQSEQQERVEILLAGSRPLPEFRFHVNLDHDNRLRKLLNDVAAAVLIEGRTIVVSPPLSNDGDTPPIAGALYTWDRSWEDK